MTNAPASLLFPSTSAIAAQLTSLEDELEKAAQIQAAQDAKIDAQVRGLYTDYAHATRAWPTSSVPDAADHPRRSTRLTNAPPNVSHHVVMALSAPS